MYIIAIICFTLYAAYLIGYYSGYRLHKADWLIEQEELWHSQLEEQYEQLYAEDIRRLVEIYESRSLLVEELREQLVREGEEWRQEKREQELFLKLLIEESQCADFLVRFPDGVGVRDYYNGVIKIIHRR